MKELGELIRSARLQKGVSLEEAADETRIRRAYLGSIEDGDFRIFPGPAYVTGFLRNYATYLGLSPDEILQTYHSINPPTAITIEPATTVGLERMRRRARKKFSWVAGSLVFLLLFFAGVDAYGQNQHSATGPRLGSQKSTSGLHPGPNTTPTITSPHVAVIKIRAIHTGWVRVHIDRKLKYWGPIHAGTHRAWRGQRVTIQSRQGASFKTVVNGHPIGLMSGKNTKYAARVKVIAVPGAWKRAK